MFRRRPSLRSLLKGLVIFELLLLPLFFIVFSRNGNAPPPYISEHPYFLYNVDLHEPRVEGIKCVLPRLHPFDPSVWNFLSPPKPIVCKSRQGELTYVDGKGILGFNRSEIEKSGYKVGKTLHCYWSSVKRAGVNEDDDCKVLYGRQYVLPENGTLLPKDVDVVQVQCQNFAGLTVYEQLHPRIRVVTKKNSLRNPVSVLIFGVDSMSRLGFIRLLPQTYRYLTEDLNMTVFRGMNKIGDNTFPNLVAMLTGRKAYGGGLPDDSEGYDEWPLIWNNYSKAGYATMWAEDFQKFGLFTYLAKGFRRPPTDHYLRPFWLAIEESSLVKFSSHMCYGTVPKHMLQINYLQDFVSAYATAAQPFFAFTFLVELSHEYLSRVASADDQFVTFFKWLKDGHHLENTILIVMSDHGHRFDAIRTTPVGHVEERLPFFAMHVPSTVSSVQTDLSEILSENGGRLLTPFDTHATLADILNFAQSGERLGRSPTPPGTLGQSIFRTVPLDRTCDNASIPAHYCACEVETPLPVTDARAQSAAGATVRRINDLLRESEGACAELSLKEIRTAHLVRTSDESVENGDVKVRVVVVAEPSGGIFEATTLVRDTSAEVHEDISRINLYGDQSSCIQNAILRKFCYCAEKIAKTAIS